MIVARPPPTAVTLNVAALGVKLCKVTVATVRSELVAANVVGLRSETKKVLESPGPVSCNSCGFIDMLPEVTKVSDRAFWPWSSLKVIGQLPVATGETVNEVPLAGLTEAMPAQAV
jgi:hypothetical protein